MTGAYIYADYCSGKIWMLRYSNGNITADSLLIDSPYFITSFGVDQSNELFILHQTSPSKIMRFSRNTTIGISGNSNIVPEKYILEQNYPNPFNSMTNIKFQMLNAGNAVIKVFDISGKEVATILNSKLNPGTYEIRFDARLGGSSTDLPSGIYFYTFSANDYRETKKFVLLK